MKKQSGLVLEIGILAMLFGILVMGTVEAVSGMVGSSGLASAGIQATQIAKAAGDLSIAVIAIGLAFLGLGIFMRSGPD